MIAQKKGGKGLKKRDRSDAIEQKKKRKRKNVKRMKNIREKK